MTLSYLYTLMGSQMHVAQYMIVQDGTLYTFTYTSSEKDEAEIQLIEESLASFSTTK